MRMIKWMIAFLMVLISVAAGQENPAVTSDWFKKAARNSKNEDWSGKLSFSLKKKLSLISGHVRNYGLKN